MTLVLAGAVLSLCLLPSLLFVGFWYGLGRMQRSPLVVRSRKRAGTTDPAVTWNDVVTAYADPQTALLSNSSAIRSTPTRDDRCSVCGAENDSFASFCRICLQKRK
nr:zinc ribbon domain-containing protein [Natrinema caseinilyticum]